MALKIKENEILANHSTFKIGGPARYFAIAKSKEEILEAINFAKEKNLPYFVLAGGSNILFSDNGYNGVIIKVSNFGFRASDLKIAVGAGVLLGQLINFSVENNLTGLEWGAGIPGTIGGCVFGNCGAYGHNISESVEKVITIEKEYLKDECEFGYRTSRFKNSPAGGNKEIILKVELKLKKNLPNGGKKKSEEEIKKNLIKRKDKIPSRPSIGCIFKNPKLQVSAGLLIEQCGLAGKQIGGAQISEKHANFIVNIGGASARNVLDLIDLCKQKAKEKFNIDLEEEIVVI